MMGDANAVEAAPLTVTITVDRDDAFALKCLLLCARIDSAKAAGETEESALREMLREEVRTADRLRDIVSQALVLPAEV